MGLFDNLGVSKVLDGLFGDAPEAPDYSGIANANEKIARLSALTRGGKFGLRGHV